MREILTLPLEVPDLSSSVTFDCVFFLLGFPSDSLTIETQSIQSTDFTISLVGTVCGKEILFLQLIFFQQKDYMVRTRSRATSPGHQESRDASSNPHHDRQSAPVMQPPSVQHIQSRAAAMTDLTCQNQELTREIGLRRQHRERYIEG